MFTNLARPVGQSLPLISFSVQENQITLQKAMASKEGQAVLTTIEASSIEQQLAQMRKAVARLTKSAEEQNLQVDALTNRQKAQVASSKGQVVLATTKGRA